MTQIVWMKKYSSMDNRGLTRYEQSLYSYSIREMTMMTVLFFLLGMVPNLHLCRIISLLRRNDAKT